MFIQIKLSRTFSSLQGQFFFFFLILTSRKHLTKVFNLTPDNVAQFIRNVDESIFS